MTVYYHVSLALGVTPEQAKIGKYSGHPEVGTSIFKSARYAKRRFNMISIAEIRRLMDLRRSIRPIHGRGEFIAMAKESIPKDQENVPQAEGAVSLPVQRP